MNNFCGPQKPQICSPSYLSLLSRWDNRPDMILTCNLQLIKYESWGSPQTALSKAGTTHRAHISNQKSSEMALLVGLRLMLRRSENDIQHCPVTASYQKVAPEAQQEVLCDSGHLCPGRVGPCLMVSVANRQELKRL